MMNKLYKTFSTCCLYSHLLLIVNVLLMKKEKDGILLFVSNSILKSNMMRGMMSFQLSDYHIDKIKFIRSSNLSSL